MKIRIVYLIILLATTSCGKQDLLTQKEKLGGYWEIKSVEMPDGNKKDFSFNSVLDFIEVSDENGRRTKVSPQLDGSFLTNGVAEKFEVRIEDDSLRLYYETPYDHWRETVLIATDSVLKIINRDLKIYTYKKFQKFNFTE
jgi:hypothetical protein